MNINNNFQIINGTVNGKKQNILISNGKIKAISEKSFNVEKSINAQNLIVSAGLIDQHTHGAFGLNFNTATKEEVLSYCNKITKYGITSVLPTIMTDDIITIKKQISIIKQAKQELPKTSCRIIGIHLEGPFLSTKYKGIHSQELLKSPLIETFKDFEDEIIKIISFAIEEDTNNEFLKYLITKNIIPSIAHSNATANDVEKAQKLGLRQVTHLFNAMSPLHHREPNVVGESLINDNLYTEIIADGIHLNSKILDLVFKVKPLNKIILISDSLPLTASEYTSCEFANKLIYKKENKATDKDGVFAGSLITLNQAVKNIVDFKIASFDDAIICATKNITNNLGLKELGKIKEEYIADLIFWDKDLNVVKTIINGEILD